MNEKKNNNKKFLIIAILIAIVLIGTSLLFKKLSNKEPKQVYEAAIMVRDQQNKDLEEDRRSSLKAGDVLLIQNEGHKWSKTESVSYLILKMNLTETQKNKLIQAKTRKMTNEEINKELEQFKQNRNDMPEDELKHFEEELKQREITLIAREYAIDMEKFEGFKPLDLLNGQPYQTEVYDWGVVNRKK